MKKLLLNENKDLRLRALLLAGLVLLAVKLVLSGAQQMYLDPEGAKLDDMFMYNAALSIAKGEWLGSYNWLTLSKHSFFALWLAVLHWLGIPYLLGGQLLWAGASLAAAFSVLPVLKKRWAGLALFAVLLFSPSSTANPAPYGFVLRVYRDNIFPALCLLCVAGMVGYALRRGEKARRSAGWLVLAGLALAACLLTREDGWWLLPFVAVAAVVTAVFILREKQPRRLGRCALLLLPFLLMAAGNLAWRGMNYHYYGRFIVSDFSSGEFADAYGAMTRITQKSWNPKVAVPYEVRRQLYDLVPLFAELEPVLESEGLKSQFAAGDYSSGSFYWALRQAAAEAGYYATPQTAKEYFESLAAQINALCEQGVLPAGPGRSSVSPPIRAEYVGPVVKEGLYSLYFCATFQQCDARSIFSPRSNDPGLYQGLVAPMEEFLHDKAQTVTVENSSDAYFSPNQNLAFLVLDGVRYLYAALLPLGLLAALAWQVWGGILWGRRLRAKRAEREETLRWLIQLGLLLCILLRAFMVAYVTVSSFTIGTYVMYLASIHPLMLLYAFTGSFCLARAALRRRGTIKAPKRKVGRG